MRFHCIGDAETVRGFRLAGVDGRVVGNASETAEALAAAVAREDCGIVILTERAAERVRPQVEALQQERRMPLIVEIPGADGRARGRKSWRQVVQEAVGMSLGPPEES